MGAFAQAIVSRRVRSSATPAIQATPAAGRCTCTTGSTTTGQRRIRIHVLSPESERPLHALLTPVRRRRDRVEGVPIHLGELNCRFLRYPQRIALRLSFA